ncbi:alpha/beta fold hydrolase [Thalassotalea marina]|uniref:Alpha/beta hydrolase n=1 Tax=Thalassotalea marina TaxID=1673741 RepID=A0A919ENX5_9GAMM|nr:alpha/beta fold hydrolase [Thalassotalea marina]GHG01195.1 alpha/beta hydrolase [Thalassotalea marina]
MHQKSLFIKEGTHQLHVRRIFESSGGTPILMLHGTIENGKIFYTESGKGLACYLAAQGFDVFVADFRGKGQSTPSINEDPKHGQHEMIVHDVPAFIDLVKAQTGKAMHVICHSWGGVIFNSALARMPNYLPDVKSIVCFGTKRSVHRKSFHKFWKVDLFWNRLAPAIAKRKGFINMVKLKFGADNETYDFLRQSIDWVKPKPWIDPEDGFDYANAAKNITWPETWHMTGINDDLLGHIDDVIAHVEETNPKAEVSLLSKQNGNLLDYDHINMLTAKQCVEDHFPKVSDWLVKRS